MNGKAKNTSIEWNIVGYTKQYKDINAEKKETRPTKMRCLPFPVKKKNMLKNITKAFFYLYLFTFLNAS